MTTVTCATTRGERESSLVTVAGEAVASSMRCYRSGISVKILGLGVADLAETVIETANS